MAKSYMYLSVRRPQANHIPTILFNHKNPTAVLRVNFQIYNIDVVIIINP